PMTQILIADDNERDHSRYAALLGGTNTGLLFCATGDEALRLAGEPERAVGLAIILWELAGQPTGAELLPLFRHHFPSLPLLVVSGLLDISRAARAKALGACDFLLKPLERERPRAALDAALSTE